MYQSLVVIDDFYDNPYEVRRKALACDYPVVEGEITFPGRNSRQKLLPQGLDQVISDIAGEPLYGPPLPQSSHGRFRVTLAGEPGRYAVHVDPGSFRWAGIVYLNLPEQCRSGTAFYRHRQSGSDRAPLTQEELAPFQVASVSELLQRDGRDPDRWEHLMTVPMRFNRLIIYRPWLWHSAGESFGNTPEDGRLVQVMHFRTPPDG